MKSIDQLREEFLSYYAGGDPDSEEMKARWGAYLLCARVNGIVPFELPKKHWSLET